jgi:predicted ferric reductase
MRQHRIHAWAIALLALIHPLCVLLPEDRLIVPLEMRYWPEWVGVGLLALLLVQFACSQWRQQVGMAYHRWLPLHRIAGLTIAVLLVVHVLYVSETFTQAGPPRLAVLIAAAIFGLTWLWIRSSWLRARRKVFTVSRVQTTGSDSTRVELTPATTHPWAYLPGQFAFVSFRSARVSAEPHAFTISSSPTRPVGLEFTIRACGDWTRRVKRLSVGDRALIQGPFGQFSHRFTDPQRELILIAGGIGITPMLSMLRYMADRQDNRPITLIWSNRSRERVVFADEMDRLENKLTGLRRIPIFTGAAEVESHSTGRLNQTMLASMLDGCSRQSAVFVCGPPRMMKRVVSYLEKLGFASRAIYSEAFGY